MAHLYVPPKTLPSSHSQQQINPESPSKATFPTPLLNPNTTTFSNSTSPPYASTTSTNTPLTAWSGHPKALGLAIDTHLPGQIFYLGTDRVPHSLAAFVTGSSGTEAESEWRAQPAQDTARWPPADEADADFAVASQLGTSSVWLY